MSGTAGYYRDAHRLHRHEPVPAAEVDRLALEARAGSPGALRELGVRLAGIAEAVASGRVAAGKGRGLAADDLRQEAMAAMLGGLARWDPGATASFRTYAYSLARFAVLNALNAGHLVKLPRSMAAYVAKGDEANLGKYAPATREAARAASSAPWELPSLDDEPVEPPREDESLARVDAERALRLARPPLTPPERRVVAALYGLDDGIARKLAAVARDEGISRTWAYALRDSALKKMRAARGAEREVG